MEHFKKYLQSKDLAQSSITHYTDYVEKFFTYTNKEALQIEKKHVLQYLQYLQDKKGYQNISRRNHLIAINHYFTYLIQNGQVHKKPTALIKIRGTHKKHLYKTFTFDELTQLYDRYYMLFVQTYDDRHIPQNQRKKTALSKKRNASILSIMLNQGATTKEVDNIFLDDLDLIQARLKINASQKSNERVLTLHATQVGLLMDYLQNVRPQLLSYHKNQGVEQLFLPLPEYSKKKTGSTNLMHVFKPLTKQMKTLDKHFLNFRQVRASVITHWIKTEGLRKAQYKAGHRYISSTENYLPNDMESLTEDVAKYNPF